MLQKEWNERLKDSGFNDIENNKNELKRQKQKYIDPDKYKQTLVFFNKLDHLLSYFKGMPKHERSIMEMFSQGVKQKEIRRKTRMSDRHIYNVIARYRALIIALVLMDSGEPRADLVRSIDPQSDSDLRTKERGKRFDQD